jgi:twinkle protein
MGYTFKSSDVLDFARSIGADVHQKGNELFFRKCPKCHGGRGDKDTFSVNLENGTFKCFRATCDYHGHFVELARDFDFDLGFGEKRVYRKLPQKPIVVRDAAIAYMASRGISEAVCRKYEITSQKNNKNVIVFPFYDDQGVLQFVKYRNAKFRPGVDKNKEWSEADTMPIPFGMKQCDGFDRLVITEGQMDSLSLAECGIRNAVSVPTGATGFTWVTNCYDWISRFNEIIVFGDNEHGKITLADGLRARLKMTIKVVRRKDYLGEKDANDILLKYGKAAVVRAVESAEVPRLENVKDLSTVQNVDLNSLQKIKTNITTVDKVIGGLVMGQLIILTGKRGEGKSTFMSQLVCEALDQNEAVFVYSGELADYHFKRWLDYQLAGPKNVRGILNDYGEFEYTLSEIAVNAISSWYKGRAYIYDNTWLPEGENETESLPDTIEKVIKQYGVRLVCIDNLMTAMETVNDGSQLNLAQSNFVGKLKKIAVKYDVAIILVAHPRKSNEAITNDDVSGSSDITNKADVVLSYQRIEGDELVNGKLAVTKNRLFGRYAVGNDAIPLRYDTATKRIFNDVGANRKYGWEQKPINDENDWLI